MSYEMMNWAVITKMPTVLLRNESLAKCRRYLKYFMQRSMPMIELTALSYPSSPTYSVLQCVHAWEWALACPRMSAWCVDLA